MNRNLVIVWILVILAFVGIGIFGYLNQDLLINVDTDTYVPKAGDKEITKVCKNKTDESLITYTFTLENDKVTKLTITYQAENGNLNGYTSASNINNASVEGMSQILSGGVVDYGLNVIVNFDKLDNATLEQYTQDLLVLKMIIDPSIENFEGYKAAINSIHDGYICE